MQAQATHAANERVRMAQRHRKVSRTHQVNGTVVWWKRVCVIQNVRGGVPRVCGGVGGGAWGRL